jgi:hypothetical protein
MGKNGVSGIIVSLEGETINRVFHHRPVIPLFVDSFPSDLEAGDRAFLFVKGGEGVLDGEGSISSVRREQVSAVRLYGGSLSLSGEELDRYVKESGKGESDYMLVLSLEDATKYARPMKCPLSIPSDGLYMTAETYFAILRENH